jgi:hypothetical protein
MVVVGKEYVQRYIGMMAWWEQGFIEGFIALANHDIHVEPPPFKKQDIKIKVVITPCPKDHKLEPEWVLSCDNATHFVTPAVSNIILLFCYTTFKNAQSQF